jgi:hypothetical protein
MKCKLLHCVNINFVRSRVTLSFLIVHCRLEAYSKRFVYLINLIKISCLCSEGNLVINNVQTDNQGEYVCHASNTAGNETVTVSLIVHGTNFIVNE